MRRLSGDHCIEDKPRLDGTDWPLSSDTTTEIGTAVSVAGELPSSRQAAAVAATERTRTRPSEGTRSRSTSTEPSGDQRGMVWWGPAVSMMDLFVRVLVSQMDDNAATRPSRVHGSVRTDAAYLLCREHTQVGA